jgi:hypothetical protein
MYIFRLLLCLDNLKVRVASTIPWQTGIMVLANWREGLGQKTKNLNYQ